MLLKRSYCLLNIQFAHHQIYFFEYCEILQGTAQKEAYLFVKLSLAIFIKIIFMMVDQRLVVLFLIMPLIVFAQSINFSAKQDAYIRGGTYAGDNFGLNDQLSLKSSASESFTRVVFLQFDLRGLNEPMIDATLSLRAKSAGADFGGSSATIYNLGSTTWDQANINWNNRPAFTSNFTGVTCAAPTSNWNITTFVSEALQTDSILNIAIEQNEGSSEDAWVHFYSSEHPTVGNHPVLALNGSSITTLLPEGNSVDWSIAGVEGGIPNYNNEVNVLTAGLVADNSTDNTIALQQLINAANEPTVFFFPEGDYLFNGSIAFSDSIIIRGECPQSTNLNFDLNGTASPSFSWRSSDVSNTTVSITAGHIKESKVITVANASGFTVGEYLEITQDNDPALMYTRSDWDVSWAQDVVGQMCEITAIDGDVISLKEPLMYDFSAELNPKANAAKMLTGAGLENLRVYRVDDGNDYNLRFDYAANCWIRNVEGAYCDRGHVALNQSAHIEVRESYFHHAYDYGGGGHAYGINLQDHSTSCLFENNIFHFLRHTFLAKEGAIGNVFSYNYSREPNGSANDIALHGHFGLMNLIEGNVVQKMIAGDFWGPSGPGNTYFRNRVEASDIIMQDATHAQNIIGNEIINGGITIVDSDDTWRLSNKNSSGFIDNIFQGVMASSLYLNEQPKFLNESSYPLIGPEFTLNQHELPAKARWADSDLDLVPCLEQGLITSDVITQRDVVQFYPNPTNASVFFSKAVTRVRVVSSQGTLVSYKVLVNNVLNLQFLADGVYFLTYHFEGNWYTKQLIIAR